MNGIAESFTQLGLKHILDISGYDHMLFLLALSLPFLLKDWKKVVLLATAFTLGHSITLGLAVFDIVRFSTEWVEFLIPVTIALVGFLDLYKMKSSNSSNTGWMDFIVTTSFGLIHGMGFSNFLRASLLPGEEHLLGWQLLFFNIGIEIGQVMVVILFIIILSLLHSLFKKSYSNIKLALTIGIIAWSLWMSFDRLPI